MKEKMKQTWTLMSFYVGMKIVKMMNMKMWNLMLIVILATAEDLKVYKDSVTYMSKRKFNDTL